MASGRRSAAVLLPLAALAIGAWVLASSCGFVNPGAVAPRVNHVALRAETADSPSPSVALVKVTEENKVAMTGVIGGVAGLLLGGVWVGAGLFAIGSYLAKKDDSDVSKALKGVSWSGIEALNFGAYVNDKYSVTGKIGGALDDALSSESNKEAKGYVDSFVKAVQNADKEIGFLDTFGKLATAGADLASQAVDKAVAINNEYKLTDQLKEKIEEATSGAKASTSSKA